MFYCVYIGNSKVSNTARDVHWGMKQASRVQEVHKRQFIQLTEFVQPSENSKTELLFQKHK